jgi:rhodanese-related sulfurtransferase
VAGSPPDAEAASDAERIDMIPRWAFSILQGIGFLALVGCSSPGDAGGGGSDGPGDAAASTPEDAAVPTEGGALPAWPADKYISVDEVYARSLAGDPEMQLVNVVDPEYYTLGHIANSLKIPWDQLSGRLGELDPARHTVLYCRLGVRSESGYTTLMDAAFPLVWVMQGGIVEWIAAGYPTVAD